MTKTITVEVEEEIAQAQADLKAEGYWDGHETSTLLHVDPSKLKDSPLNYRKTFDKADIDDIAKTAKDLGILETLMGRRVKGGIELVFGHKRKRAAIQCKLKTVPVVVRDWTDRGVRIAQMVENSKRADVHPLEEADGMMALIKKEKMSVMDISAALARTPASIYRRLALTHLCPTGRKAFFDGDLRTGVAELIARLGDPKAQAKAVKDLAGETHEGGLVSIKAAKRTIERDYLRELKGAPFDTKDADLVPSAGACAPCPKRTGANSDLFGDITGKNVCTDGVCFEEKASAGWKKASAKHTAAGGKLLPRAEASKVFPYKRSSSMARDCGYTDVDSTRYHGEPTHASTIKKAKGELPPIVLARAPDGAVRRLVKTTDLNAAMKRVGGGGRKQGSFGSTTPRSPAEKKADDRRDREADIRRRTKCLAFASIADKVAKVPSFDSVGLWHVLAILAIEGAWHDTVKATCSRRGVVVPKGGHPDAELLKHARAIVDGKASPDTSKATTCELLAALTFEVMLKDGTLDTDKWKAVRTFLRIDLKKLEKKARDERAVEDTAKRDAAKAKAKRKAAKAKPKKAAKKKPAAKKKKRAAAK